MFPTVLSDEKAVSFLSKGKSSDLHAQNGQLVNQCEEMNKCWKGQQESISTPRTDNGKKVHWTRKVCVKRFETGEQILGVRFAEGEQHPMN